MTEFSLLYALPVLLGWILDLLLGDPARLPHPVVYMGKTIAFFEKCLNKGKHRALKGGTMSVLLIAFTALLFYILLHFSDKLPIVCAITIRAIFVFYFLAGTTLIREVREVFRAVDRSLEDGRKQIARIVGRETGKLSAQEIRTAALETLAENLSDGVVAPLFWLAVGGLPAMAAYKMANTLDSMIGYKTERYKQFGMVAAKADDLLNWIPARLTAFLMAVVSGEKRAFAFIGRYARCHASPNSGYPESALAGILDARFGGSHTYFGEVIDKPYIGHKDKVLSTADLKKAIRVNRAVEFVMVTSTVAATAIAATAIMPKLML